MDLENELEKALKTGEGDDMTFFDAYKPMDMEKAEQEIKAMSEEFVSSIKNLYVDIHGDDEQSDSDMESFTNYANAIGELEISSMSVFLFQIKVQKHIVTSLMLQLNAGGYQDYTTFMSLNNANNTLLNIITKAIAYFRSIPEFYRKLVEDYRIFKQASIETPTLSSGATDLDYEDLDDEEEEEYTMFGEALRGTSALIDAYEEARTNLSDLEDSVKDVDVSREGNLGDNPLRDEKGDLIIEKIQIDNNKKDDE